MKYVHGTFCANNSLRDLLNKTNLFWLFDKAHVDSDTRCNVLQLRFGARSSSQTALVHKLHRLEELK